MAICENRADGGFGSYKGDATTCMEDALIIPLPALILFFLFVMAFAIKKGAPIGSSSTTSTGTGHIPLSNKYSVTADNKGVITLDDPAARLAGKARMRLGHRLLLIFVTFLLVAVLAMHCLEVARLAVGELGIGLIPINILACFIVLLSMYIPLHGTNKLPNQARPHTAFWSLSVPAWALGMAVVEGVKIHTLYRVGSLLASSIDKTQSKHAYPVSDRQLDNIVIVALYGLIFLSYFPLTFKDRLRAAK